VLREAPQTFPQMRASVRTIDRLLEKDEVKRFSDSTHLKRTLRPANRRQIEIMDRRERFLHLVIEAIEKARQLKPFALDAESQAKTSALMERVQKSRKTMEALNRAAESNGKGLDKVTLDRALDRLIETMDGLNEELDALLAKAKGK
jgi:hypothetical protein